MNYRLTLLLTFSLLVVPLSASSEMQMCNGVWTNTSCDTLKKNKSDKTEVSQEEIERQKADSQKRSMLHEITMKSLEARREHGVDLSLSGIEEVCRDEGSSVKECRQEIERYSDRLNTRITQAIQIKAAQQKERKTEVARDSEQGPTVVVIENRPNYLIRRRYHHDKYHHDGPHDSYSHGSHTQGSASVSVNGTTGNGNYSVGVSTHGSSHEHRNQVRNFGRPANGVAPSRATAVPQQSTTITETVTTHSRRGGGLGGVSQSTQIRK